MSKSRFLGQRIFLSQQGTIQALPVLVIIAVVGLISFLLITSLGPFKEGNLARTFPKPVSQASTNQSFGINDHLMWQGISQTQTDLDQLKLAGIMTVRFDVAWKWLEPLAKGQYDSSYLATLDQTMQAISQRGMLPIITFLQPPAWALGQNTGQPSDCADLTSGLCPPQNMQDYADSYAFLANRYKLSNPDVVWEIWNEPNMQVFWRTNAGPNVRDYTLMLQKAFTSIKQVAPQARVIGGVIAFNDQTFLDGMYKNGAKGYFDGLDIHPYAKSHPPDDVSEPFYSFKASIEQMEAKMSQNGEPGKPIYITEMGWDSQSMPDANLRASFYQKSVQMAKTYPYIVTMNPYTFKVTPGDLSSNTAALVVNGVATLAWNSYITEIPKLGNQSSQTGVNLLQNPSFEQNPPTFSPWSFAATNGAVATLSQDATTSTHGQAAALINVTTAAPSFAQSWYVQLRQISQAITQNQQYTISFDAKTTNPEQISFSVQQAKPPYLTYYNQNVNLTTSWTRYTYTFNSPATDGFVMLNFNVGETVGKVWLDNILFCTPVACTPTPLPTPTPTVAPTPQGSIITITAAGQLGIFNGITVSPTMVLNIGGSNKQTWTNVGGNGPKGQFLTFTYSSPTKVTHDQVRVRFTNDQSIPGTGQDVNLYVKQINIDGQSFPSNAPGVYSIGVWTPTTGCSGGYKTSIILSCDGFFQY